MAGDSGFIRMCLLIKKAAGNYSLRHNLNKRFKYF